MRNFWDEKENYEYVKRKLMLRQGFNWGCIKCGGLIYILHE